MDRHTRRELDSLVKAAIDRDVNRRIARERAQPGLDKMLLERPVPAWKQDKRI